MHDYNFGDVTPFRLWGNQILFVQAVMTNSCSMVSVGLEIHNQIILRSEKPPMDILRLRL